MSTCWSVGKAALAPFYSDLPNAGLTVCASPTSTTLTLTAFLVTVYFPFLSPASHMA